MNPFVFAPRRWRVVIVGMLWIIGCCIGAFIPHITLLYAYCSIVLIGVGLLFRRYGFSLFALGLASMMLGGWWSTQAVERYTLQDSFHYHGAVDIVSVRDATPPQKRVVMRLLEGHKKGTYVRTRQYEWGYEPGTGLDVDMNLSPSTFVSDRGYGVIGTTNDLKVEHVARKPRGVHMLRARMASRVGASLPEPYASLAMGLITGVNDAFDAEFKEELRVTGTTHIVAVSGYNLTIVALLLRRWGNRRSRWVGLSLAMGGIVFYIVLAGANPSIVRGAIVAGLALYIAASGRIMHRSTLLVFGAVMLTLFWPLGPLYNLSWQLSFLAFTGILFAAPLLKNILRRRLKGVGESLGETLGAELMVLPLIMYQFGVISIISPLVNVVVLSVTPLAMAVSAIQAFASLLYLPLGRVVAWVSYPILWSIVKPIEWGSKIPFADFEISRIPLPYFVGSYVVVLGILYGLKKLEDRYASAA